MATLEQVAERPFVPVAMFFADSDCVEYVREDGFCVYERIDGFLTLIFDETKLRPIGFKLKGFKHFFETTLRPLYRLNDEQFLELVSVLEEICKKIGDDLFVDDDRERAYKAACKIARQDNARIYSQEFAAAETE